MHFISNIYFISLSSLHSFLSNNLLIVLQLS